MSNIIPIIQTVKKIYIEIDPRYLALHASKRCIKIYSILFQGYLFPKL